MFNLQVINPDVTSGTITVSWCLDKETLEQIIADIGPNPQVVIVVSPTKNYHPGKEVRYVVPLRDLLTFVSFKCPGPNKIWAFVPDCSEKTARNKFLEKPGSAYYYSVLNHDGDDWGYQFRKSAKKDDVEKEWFEPNYSSTLEVTVPEEVFAPEPPQWEKDWVNHFFTSKAFDQCHFRRRRLFAYTIQPIVMSVLMAVRLVITIMALLIGARNFSFQPLLHPLTYGIEEQLDIMAGGTIFIREWPDLDTTESPSHYFLRCLRAVVFLPFMPIIVIVLGLSIIFTFKPLLVVLGVIAGVLTFFALFALGFYLIKDDGWNDLLNWLDNRSEQLDEQDKDLLICTPDRKVLTLENVPSKKKSIRLRFQNLKAKVCRPFAG